MPRRLAGQAFLYGTAGAMGKAAALFAVPYLTRQLGPNEYGIADLATSLAGVLVLVVRFSGDIPTMRRVAGIGSRERRRVYGSFAAATLVVSVAIPLALLPFSGLIAADLWSAAGSTVVAVAALGLIPINAVQAALASVLRFEQRPRAFAAVATVDLLAQLVLAVLFAAAGMGALGIIVGYAAGGLIGLVAAAITVRKYLGVPRGEDALAMVREGLPFLPSVVAFYFADVIARMLSANGLGVASVGNLALAIRIGSLMGLATGAFSAAWGPYALAQRPTPKSQRDQRRVLWVLVILAGTGSISAGAVGPEIARVISGEEFLAAGEAVPNILLSAGFLAVLYVLTTAAGVIGRGSRVAWSVLAGAALQVAATPLLLSWLGIGGFAVASVLGRVAAVWLLGSAVRTMAPLGAGPLGAMVLLLVGTTGIQILNGSPDSTLVPRIVIAVTAAAVGAIVIVRLWTGRRFGHVSLAGSAE